MNNYNNITDKDSVFRTNSVINTKNDFEDWLSRMNAMSENKKLHIAFRGHNEAKYKMFNSFQRLWETRHLDKMGITMDDAIIKMIDKCRDGNNTLNKYLKQLGVTQNDWQYLAFLQHYGAHTPLLDFTHNISAALFFACKDVTYTDSGIELDEYISIYYYKMVDASIAFPNIKKIATNIANSLTKEDAKKKLLREHISFSEVIQTYKIVLLPTYSHPTPIIREIKNRKDKVAEIVLSNINTTNQDGEFICNMSGMQPLEDVFQSGGKKYLNCVNIHKSLVDYIIKNHLFGSLDIAKKQYFKDEYDIAEEIESVFLSQQ